MRLWKFQFVAVLSLFWAFSNESPGQGLSIGPTTNAECSRICRELVFDCGKTIHNPVTRMCTIVQDTPPFASGKSVWTTNAECNMLRANLYTNWVFQAVKNDRGWCTEREGYAEPNPNPGSYPGNQGSCGRAPDLTRVFPSDYGDIALSRSGEEFRGFYGDLDKRNKSLDGRLHCENGSWVFEGVWKHLGTTKTGSFKFNFSNSATNAFTGSWAYASSPTSSSPWNGKGF